MARTIDKIATDYKTLAAVMMGPGSTQAAQLKLLQESFDLFQLSNEQMGEVIAQTMAATSASFNKDAITAATEYDTKNEQALLLKRQIQGYDDNMLLKIVEHQAGLASFAVNANANNAQEPIDALKQKMVAVEARVQPLDGSDSCPAIPRVVPPPSNLIVTNVIETGIDLQWDSVIDATQYLVYRDGILISTSDKLTHVDTGLTTLTKYVYAVKASISGLESNYTDAISQTTL